MKKQTFRSILHEISLFDLIILIENDNFIMIVMCQFDEIGKLVQINWRKIIKFIAIDLFDSRYICIQIVQFTLHFSDLYIPFIYVFETIIKGGYKYTSVNDVLYKYYTIFRYYLFFTSLDKVFEVLYFVFMVRLTNKMIVSLQLKQSFILKYCHFKYQLIMIDQNIKKNRYLIKSDFE